MRVHVPVPLRDEDEGPVRVLRADHDRPAVLGVIDDGFGASLLPPVVEDLRTTLGLIDVVYHRKENLSARVDGSTLDTLSDRCRAVVVGICA